MRPGQANALVALVVVLTVGVFAVLGVTVWSHFQTNSQLAHKASNAHVLATLKKGERNSCIAQNITRATDNRSHLKDFELAMKVIAGQAQQIEFTKGSLHSNYVALQHLGISQRVLRRALRQSLAQLKSSEASLRSERADARAKTWTALTNCAASPRAGSSVRVYLIATKHPPQSAMQFKNAEQIDPVGSVPRH